MIMPVEAAIRAAPGVDQRVVQVPDDPVEVRDVATPVQAADDGDVVQAPRGADVDPGEREDRVDRGDAANQRNLLENAHGRAPGTHREQQASTAVPAPGKPDRVRADRITG